MSWLIIWLIVCGTAGALILAIRHKRVAVGGRKGQEVGEPASLLWVLVERCGWCFGIVSGLAAMWTLAATPSSGPAKTPSLDPSDPSSVVASSDGYPLRPCSWLDCNDRDKLDLDTGDPGHGSSSIQVGSARNGGPAEIVLDDDRIHGSDTTARYVIAPATASGPADCVNLLAHHKYRRLEIALDDLPQGTNVCVETNEKRVALVSIMRVDYAPVDLEIAFTTWQL